MLGEIWDWGTDLFVFDAVASVRGCVDLIVDVTNTGGVCVSLDIW